MNDQPDPAPAPPPTAVPTPAAAPLPSTAPTPPAAPPPPAAPAAPDYQFPLAFYAQLAHPVRLWILRALAQGKELTPKQVAKAWGRKHRAINLHCQSLNDAGLISWRPGADRRSDTYFLPEQFRREPGWLDYGFCRFRIW